MSKQRLIDGDALMESFENVLGAAPCELNGYEILEVLNAQEPIDAITVSWIEDQISQHTSETGWTDWWADMCRRFLQEYERRRDEG